MENLTYKIGIKVELLTEGMLLMSQEHAAPRGHTAVNVLCCCGIVQIQAVAKDYV